MPQAGKQVSIEPCHACGQDMRFELDLGVNGNHVLNCPKCGHEHCRVVRNGRVTGDRWDSRNGPTIQVTATYYYYSAGSTCSASTGNYILQQAWNDSTAGW
jgi:hypothetical protein